MVKPGSAWKKPGVNPGFRSAVVAHARQAAAQPPIDKLEEKLREVVSRLDTDRRGDAHRAISQACKKLRDGKNPLEGLKPPADCAPCHGRKGGTHHFLCAKRVRNPSPEEVRARDKVRALLNIAYAETIGHTLSEHEEVRAIELFI